MEAGSGTQGKPGALEKAMDDYVSHPLHISPRVAGRRDTATFPVVWALSFVFGVGSGFWASLRGSESTTLGVAPRPSPPIEDGEPEKMVVSSLANPGVAMPSACRSLSLA